MSQAKRSKEEKYMSHKEPQVHAKSGKWQAEGTSEKREMRERQRERRRKHTERERQRHNRREVTELEV